MAVDQYEHQKRVKIHREFLRERKAYGQKKKVRRGVRELEGLRQTSVGAGGLAPPATRTSEQILLKQKAKKPYEKRLRARATAKYGY